MSKQTPLEKANELVNKFYECIQIPNPDKAEAISCALVCVQEIIELDPYQYIYDYYVLVKRELEKMLK